MGKPQLLAFIFKFFDSVIKSSKSQRVLVLRYTPQRGESDQQLTVFRERHINAQTRFDRVCVSGHQNLISPSFDSKFVPNLKKWIHLYYFGNRRQSGMTNGGNLVVLETQRQGGFSSCLKL